MTTNGHHYGDAGQFRLAGEDAPIWPAAAFACIGALLALAASGQIFGASEKSASEVATPYLSAPAPVDSVAHPSPEPGTQEKSLERSKAEGPGVEPSGVSPGGEAADKTPTASIVAAVPAGAAEPKAAPAICLPVVSIPFSRNSARPKIDGLERDIAPLRNWLAAHPGAVISVEGHADSSGPERYNIVLSYSRAQAVRAWLARGGAPESQLAVRAAGTLPPTNVPVAAESNRQVILRIEGVETCRNGGAPAKTPRP